jgi:hypothetical protein
LPVQREGPWPVAGAGGCLDVASVLPWGAPEGLARRLRVLEVESLVWAGMERPEWLWAEFG